MTFAMFIDRKFVSYCWIGAVISIINIVLLWVTIDVLGIPTIIAGTVIIGGTFVLRYALFVVFRVVK